jgi:transaldolase
MTKLNDLYDQQGQSPWVDNLKRSYMTEGTLKKMIDDGVRGVTSNPSIFQKSISEGNDYDEQFAELAKTLNVEDSYWGLVVKDVTDACHVMRPVYDESGGNDGFVSIEVSPALATDEKQTTIEARKFHTQIDLPNLMVKIPATKQCLPSIQQMIAEGRNINVTLIFDLERYAAVMEAYIAGLEEFAASGATNLAKVNSVASFFISRVDTEVDRRLDALGTPEATALKGKAAVAQGKLAYKLYQEKFSGPRWDALATKGAKPQRVLWASTSTKNPAYPDLLYVDNLIGPHTVNTMPDAVVAAFADHGTVARTVDAEVDTAEKTWADLTAAGVDLADVAKTLETEGVTTFVKAYDELLQVLADKYELLRDQSR